MAHPAFHAAPRIRAGLWRLPLGLATALLGMALWMSALLTVAAVLVGVGPYEIAFQALWDQGSTPFSALLLLLAIGGLYPATRLSARLWHGARRRHLVGRPARTLRDFAAALLVSLMVLGVPLALYAALSPDVVSGLPARIWAVLLVPSLAALALQTGGEEILFRGYLQGILTARGLPRGLAVALPAALFGLVHYSPAMTPAETAATLGLATAFGLMAGDLTARTGSLGAAWGFHFANNALVILFLAPQEAMSGLALTRVWSDAPVAGPDPLTALLDLALLVLAWRVIRRILMD